LVCAGSRGESVTVRRKGLRLGKVIAAKPEQQATAKSWGIKGDFVQGKRCRHDLIRVWGFHVPAHARVVIDRSGQQLDAAPSPSAGLRGVRTHATLVCHANQSRLRALQCTQLILV
jgi:hypothetical protein